MKSQGQGWWKDGGEEVEGWKIGGGGRMERGAGRAWIYMDINIFSPLKNSTEGNISFHSSNQVERKEEGG